MFLFFARFDHLMFEKLHSVSFTV